MHAAIWASIMPVQRFASSSGGSSDRPLINDNQPERATTGVNRLPDGRRAPMEMLAVNCAGVRIQMSTGQAGWLAI